MDFVSPVIDIVCCLWEPIARRVRIITKLHENVGSLRNAMEELIEARNDVKSRVEAAERQLWKRTNQVNGWLQRVETTQDEVTAIEDATNQRRRCLGDCHPNCWSSYKLGKRVAKKLADVAELKSKSVFNEVAERPPPDPVTEMPSTSTVGMDLTMQKVLRYLGEDSVGVIGIYGMGGVGKTTLLTKINNHFLQRTHDFNVVIWVVVSKEPNVGQIQNDIRQKLGLPLPGDQDQGVGDIFSVLRRKRFVVLLDDVWARFDLEEVGIPLPTSQNKSKLIITTRSEEVCGQMEARRKIKVECLAQKEAWDLFKEKVGEEALNYHPEIPKLAEEVAEKCDGLPLALITIGRAMASKKTPPEWKHAIKVLSSSPSQLPGMEDQVLRRLKFSYDNLNDDRMRECFLYCSLFPEDYNIPKLGLINYWIGEGFLDNDESDDLDEARNRGHYLIGRLKDACLLEDGLDEERIVKMHDVIRELALWIASEYGVRKDKFIVRAGVHLTKPPMLENCEETKRISLMENKLEALLETPTCPSLLTLMLQGNRKLKMISNHFFKSMHLLRVLDLSRTGLEELPTGISELVELQHLNLSNAKIVALPKELVNLVKLKHLDLSWTSQLETIPHEMIAGLSRLQVLSLHFSEYRNWKVEGSNDSESGINLLAELEHLKHLKELTITISNVDSLNRFLGSQIFTKCIRYLSIDNCNALTCFHLSSTFGNMKRLITLFIKECPELEELIIDADVEGANKLLPNLKLLSLDSLYKLKTILVPKGCLQNLRDVHISKCNELKNVTWVLHLHNLESISLMSCKGIEEIIGDEVEATTHDLITFPRVKQVNLGRLPKLKSICRHAMAFRSLQSIFVRDCPNLKRLPFGPGTANNTLREIRGEKKWWDGLEWEDENIKSTFLSYFKAL